MKIYIGSDHGGFYLKEKIEAYLSKRGIEWEDVGDKELDPHDDFPQFAQMAATKLLGEDEKNRSSGDTYLYGWTRDGDGGKSISGIRAAVIWDSFEARECRNDNNSNVLCLPARVVDADGDDLALWKDIIDTWLATPFAGAARFVRRNAELDMF